jgi:GT2 family glycosyltransferase
LIYLDYPRDRFEVIVVDDGSKLPPEAVVESFRDQLDVTLLAQAHAGPATARNTGAARAKGEFLAFTDDDCAPDPGWLNALAARLTTAPTYLLGGRTLNALPENLYSAATHLLVAYLYATYNADPDRARFFTSNNLAVSAGRFHAIGGFNTTFPFAAGEDREFCDRWLHLGHPMAYVSEALVYHAHALTFRQFWRQHYYYGRGAFHFHQIRAHRDQRGIQVEPLSFYLDLLQYPFSQVQGWRALWLVALLMVAQVASAAGFFWERVKRTTQVRK